MRLENLYLDRPVLRERFVERFWEGVDKSGGPDACWPWTGVKLRGGYGAIRAVHRGRSRGLKAHRVAFMLANGEVQDDLMVLHSCDNRVCCNPDHLFQGTHLDNMRDMDRKGRRRGEPPHRRGERANGARLTEAKVREIRDRYAVGGTTHRKLALRYGVSDRTIRLIVLREAWAHIK